jgi:hypothetical protein
MIIIGIDPHKTSRSATGRSRAPAGWATAWPSSWSGP